jgi:uncharacterized repeat protein (TIGR03803 family)
VFELDDAGVLTPFHDFVGSEGTAPQGLTLASDGTLWGAVSNPPAVYRLGPAGEFFFVAAVEGDGPYGELAEAVDGSFVGATLAGGATTLGTLFRVDAAGDFETLHTFSGWDGAYPSGRPILAPDGNFYGLTVSGGSQNFGTIYRMSPSGRVTMIHSFSAVDGLSPFTGLTLGEDGYLYGTTRFGGDHALGNLFRADASGNVLSLYSFSGSDGREPLSQLIQATDGGLYGATNLGGLFGGGVVFRVEPPSALSVWTATPSSGPAAGGTPVTVTGFHFSHPSVTIGGATATDVVWTDPSTLTAATPALPPGTLNDIVVTNFDTRTGSLANAWLADFVDVPQGDPFHGAVETVFRGGITAGCGSGAYCRNDDVTRGQMAVFLLKGKHGAGYLPPACTGVFADVPCPGPFTDWIEQLSNEGITGGCGGGNFCPSNPVTRAQIAAFLLKAKHGSTYSPAACAGIFGDVACPSPFADWIEQLYADGITGGCQASPLLYCPASPSTRGQMAVFLVKTFSLP